MPRFVWLSGIIGLVVCGIPVSTVEAKLGSIVRKHEHRSASHELVEVTESGLVKAIVDTTLPQAASDGNERQQHGARFTDRTLGQSLPAASKAELLESTGFAAEAFYAGNLEQRSYEHVQLLQDIAAGRVDKSKTEIVLAHFDEDLSWTAAFRGICSIYTKSPKVSSSPDEIRLPNVGREGHTFLHHIVHNYEILADWTVFSQAGAPTAGYRGHREGGGHMLPNVSFADYVLHNSSTVDDGSFILFTSVINMDSLLVANRRSFETKLGPEHPSRCPSTTEADPWNEFKSLGWFYGYLAQKCNITVDNVNKKFKDYWQQHVSKEILENGNVFYAQGARFAMSRERIHQRPRSYYAQLLDLVSDSIDPCANYFNEWTWFYMIGDPGTQSACSELPPSSKHVQA